MDKKTKTIHDLMEEIDKGVARLKKLLEEKEVITHNKIWLPGKGIVTLWEPTQNGR